MHQHKSSSNITDLGEFSGRTISHVNNRHMLRRSQSRRPGDGYSMDGKRGSAVRARPSSLSRLSPRVLNAEFFGVDTLCASFFESRHAPLHRSLESGSTRDPAANFIGQTAKISFQRRRLQRLRNQPIRSFAIGIAISR